MKKIKCTQNKCISKYRDKGNNLPLGNKYLEKKAIKRNTKSWIIESIIIKNDCQQK